VTEPNLIAVMLPETVVRRYADSNVDEYNTTAFQALVKACRAALPQPVTVERWGYACSDDPNPAFHTRGSLEFAEQDRQDCIDHGHVCGPIVHIRTEIPAANPPQTDTATTPKVVRWAFIVGDPDDDGYIVLRPTESLAQSEHTIKSRGRRCGPVTRIELDGPQP
jgi:hypothetical protein